MSDTQTTTVNSKETGKEPGRESQKETTEAISASANQTATKPAAKTEGSAGQGLCDPQSREPLYNRPLFVIVTSMLVIQLVLLVGSLWFQYRNYAFGIALAQQAGAGPESVSLILIYSRAWDFAVTKTVSLFLGYMVLYTGALYVLRSADTSYELSIAQGTQQGASLKTSSPGLVLVTLGGALIALVLQSRSEVGVNVHPRTGANGETETAVVASTASAAAAPASEAPVPAPVKPASPAPAPVARPAAPAAPSAAADDHRMPRLLEPR
ncbi:MAG TPA: hypothetical protein PLY80_13520 [Pseudomonadota bacterium]|nr:hypothetical protein [Pseudomonadota bacterium]